MKQQILRHLLNGDKIAQREWMPDEYLQLLDCDLVDDGGNILLTSPDLTELAEEFNRAPPMEWIVYDSSRFEGLLALAYDTEVIYRKFRDEGCSTKYLNELREYASQIEV